MSPLKRLVLAAVQNGSEWCAVTLSEEIGCSVSGAGNAAMSLLTEGYLKISRTVKARQGSPAKNFYKWTGKPLDWRTEEVKREQAKPRYRTPQADVYPALWAAVNQMVAKGRGIQS
ncbi:hypothetical protein [Pararobbsia alpina]|uniref:Uncharacterized protein n=1 Tax=Pararobbsia alpina TaxID=621374 RepID=A0A6S7BCU3_9BURK|nr:hypothetical protein [Pararobbsia alpina]CAB3784469.1 hypothetical protein LMG28138_01816 [Pararobbsia alpina]